MGPHPLPRRGGGWTAMRGAGPTLVVLAVCTLLGAAPAQADTFGPNLRVNHAGEGYHQTDPEIVVGPEGTIYAVWEDWRVTTGSVHFTRSLDGGLSFEPERRVDPPQAPGYGTPMLVRWPCLAVDGNGLVYVAWVIWEHGQTGRIYCARSIDEGMSFGSPVLVSDSEQDDRAWPEASGSPGGGVHITWGDFRNGPDVIDLYTAYSPDGTSFRANVKANRIVVGPTCTPPLPDIALGGDPDRVHIVWRHTTTGWNRWIYAARSLDGGLTWELPVEVSHEPWVYDG